LTAIIIQIIIVNMGLRTEGEQLMLTNITTDSLLSKNHVYRKMLKVLNLAPLLPVITKKYSKMGKKAIDPEKGIRMLLLQFLEDASDREMERQMEDSIACKYFAGYELSDITPDHSYFGDLRKRLGTELIAEVFNLMVQQINDAGLSGKTFTFIDSTTIITKSALWEERDKAKKDDIDKMNNSNVGNYSADKDARFGCKGKRKFWFGHKRHVAVDMKSGIIKKVVVTAANIPDGDALKSVCPKDGGMIFADKAYSHKKNKNVIIAKGCYIGGVINKNNNKEKNFDKDRWTTKVRMPYEGTFSKFERRARYRGNAKVQLQAFLEAITFNLKRWVAILDLQKTLIDEGRLVPCVS